jgi:hypothetical protein
MYHHHKLLDALFSMLFKLNFEYTIRKAQENWEGLKLNETHQLLVYAVNNLLSKNINTLTYAFSYQMLLPIQILEKTRVLTATILTYACTTT